MNHASEPPTSFVQAAQDPNESPLNRMHKENNTHTNQSQPSNPPETPNPPSACGPNDTRAPEPVSLPERHHAALRHIHTLENHNARLYQDNCRLVNAVNMLNDRLAFLGAPQNVQVHRLADLQEMLRTSEANRALINQKYQELQQCASAGSAHHQTSVELQAIREAYTSLDREYRLLGDKYIRLKAVVDTSRVASASTPHIAPGSVPVVRSEARVNDQHSASPSSVVLSPNSYRALKDQPGHHQRRSSGSVIAQPSLSAGTTPVGTTWLAPLSTPLPSSPPAGGQIFPPGLPVHASVPVGSLPFPPHAQKLHDLRASFKSSPASPLQPPLGRGASEQPREITYSRRSSRELMNTANNGPIPCGKQISFVQLESNHRPPKRPSIELQASTSPGGEYKKPRIDGDVAPPPTIDVDICPASKTLSPPGPTIPSNDHKLSASGSDVRSFQDCVNLIFEKDANVENGVFCGLCLDRYEAKMIQEPPDILVQPELDLLVTHCKTMHPAVWDDIRHQA